MFLDLDDSAKLILVSLLLKNDSVEHSVVRAAQKQQAVKKIP
jgi:hypothetical protein